MKIVGPNLEYAFSKCLYSKLHRSGLKPVLTEIRLKVSTNSVPTAQEKKYVRWFLIIWVIAECQWVGCYRSFVGARCSHLQGPKCPRRITTTTQPRKLKITHNASPLQRPAGYH